MNNNFFTFLKDKRVFQKGVVLLVTFVIMGIIITIVLGVSVILLSELKMTRGMGNSVIAYYAAETGIEKTLYYDRQKIPTGGTRGICNICNSCPSNDCQSCETIGNGCGPTDCTACTISYTTQLTNKMFKVVVTISEKKVIYQSYGVYEEITRAIELSGS